MPFNYAMRYFMCLDPSVLSYWYLFIYQNSFIFR
jgi:hypothetical protein